MLPLKFYVNTVPRHSFHHTRHMPEGVLAVVPDGIRLPDDTRDFTPDFIASVGGVWIARDEYGAFVVFGGKRLAVDSGDPVAQDR